MLLDEKSIEDIKEILATELPPALIKLWNEKGPEMQAAITADVVGKLRPEFQKEHAENRVRLQSIDITATQAEQKASSADAKATEILARVDEHYDMAKTTDQLVRDLSNRFSEWDGERRGGKDERSRWIKVGQAVGTLATGSGVLKLIQWLRHHR